MRVGAPSEVASAQARWDDQALGKGRGSRVAAVPPPHLNVNGALDKVTEARSL